MTGSTHKIGGFTFGLFCLTFNLFLPTVPVLTYVITIPSFLIGCIIGALFPDFDSPNSTISRLLWFIAWPLWVLQWIIKKTMKLLEFIVSKIFKGRENKKIRNYFKAFAKNTTKAVGHRGFTHWLSLGIVYYIILLIASLIPTFQDKFSFYFCFELVVYFIYGTIIGDISHIVLDSFNDRGVALLAPFSFKRFHFAKVKTGHRLSKKTIFTTSKSENVFIVILLAICLSLIVFNLYNYL